jgi:hypothetical protein
MTLPLIGYSKRIPYATAMIMIKHMLAATLILGVTLPAQAQTRRAEQDAAYQATRDGAVRSLRSIENGIVPRMKARGADYIGAEFMQPSQQYRLKFMRGSSVIWVDVDGRSGAIVNQAGE